MFSYNYFQLIGTITNFIKQHNDYVGIELTLTQPFKNSDGVFEEYTLNVFFNNFLMETIYEKSSCGSVISVVGSIANSYGTLVLLGDRITFFG